VLDESDTQQIGKLLDELAQLGKTDKSVVPYLANVLATRRPNVDHGCNPERYVMIALARTGDVRALPILQKQLMRPDEPTTTRVWDIWTAAAFALGKTGNPVAIEILRQAHAAGHAAEACQRSIEALGGSLIPPSIAVVENRCDLSQVESEYGRVMRDAQTIAAEIAAKFSLAEDEAYVQVSILRQGLQSLPVEDERDAYRALSTQGTGIRKGDFSGTLTALLQCLMADFIRYKSGLRRGWAPGTMMKRSGADGFAGFEQITWLGVYSPGEHYIHAIIRVGENGFLTFTH
jgi:hypothetical protein